jgi:hypothetical protein
VTLRKLPTTALTIKLVARTNTGRKLSSTYRIARCGTKPKKKTTRKKSSGKRAR